MSWKLSSTVLRGAVGGNADCLLDRKPDRKAFRFCLSNERPFGFAGLWDAWKGPDGSWLQSFSVITTDPNSVVASVHNRMPVILAESDYDEWLDREEVERPPAHLLKPLDPTLMLIFDAHPRIGNVHNQGPEMLNSYHQFAYVPPKTV